MTTRTKSRSASHTVEFRDAIEASAQRSEETLETFGAAASDLTKAMQELFSTGLKGLQSYNGKVAEFTQANINSYVEFVQRLANVKSPTEFIAMSTSHTRQQLETLTEQSKQLAALAQQATLDAVEPLKTGFAKVPLAPR